LKEKTREKWARPEKKNGGPKRTRHLKKATKAATGTMEKKYPFQKAPEKGKKVGRSAQQ